MDLHFSAYGYTDLEMGFRAGDEEGTGQMQHMQPLEVEVRAIHGVDVSDLGQQQVGEVDVVQSGVGDVDKVGVLPRWSSSVCILSTARLSVRAQCCNTGQVGTSGEQTGRAGDKRGGRLDDGVLPCRARPPGQPIDGGRGSHRILQRKATDDDASSMPLNTIARSPSATEHAGHRNTSGSGAPGRFVIRLASTLIISGAPRPKST